VASFLKVSVVPEVTKINVTTEKVIIAATYPLFVIPNCLLYKRAKPSAKAVASPRAGIYNRRGLESDFIEGQ
jgi:hypothetical protein